MKLIVTRPESDAATLSDKLARLGHEAVLLPLLSIVPRTNIVIPNEPWQAVCLTSANAARSFPATNALKNLRAFTVGPESRNEALACGYAHATAHGGDVNGLSEYISRHFKPADGPILYLAGSTTSGDLAGKLKSHRFTVVKIIVYDAKPTVPENLTSTIAAADGVLLYSPRTAETWMAAIMAAKTQEMAARLPHYCLSANVASRLPASYIRHVAATPDESGILSLLDQSA